MPFTPAIYEQKIVYARGSLWLPYHAVGMVARVRGDVSPALLENALRKLKVHYPPLASRVRLKPDGSAYLTSAGVGEFSLEVRDKASDDDWLALFLEQERLPFEFERGPVARFFLLRSPASSDVVAVTPHVICDGNSMTLVMMDLAALLNDPAREVAPLPNPPLVTWQTVSHSPFDALPLRILARLLNWFWSKPPVVNFTQYREFHRQYWERQHNDALYFQLSPAETSALAARCKQNGVSVGGALAAAFSLARDGDWPQEFSDTYQLWVAVNIGDRVSPPPGRAVGVYASAVNLRLPARAGVSFWDLAREFHALIHRSMEDRSKLFQTLVLDELDPRLVDGLGAAFCSNRWTPAYRLVSRIAGLVGDPRCLNLSNIGRIELPAMDGPHHLETLLPFPPISPSTRLSLNTMTVDGCMHLVLKYRQDQFDLAAITRIKERALGYMLDRKT